MSRSTAICAAAVTAALALQGCSSRPREFNPVLAAAPADSLAYDAAYQECRQLVAQGKVMSEGRVASAGAGAAAAAATGAAGTAVASGAAGWGGFAVLGATVILAPFAVAGGAWGMAKAKKAKKEKLVKTATAQCLEQQGYEVEEWEPAKGNRSR